MPSATDIFELTTRSSRNAAVASRSRNNSAVPTPSLSRDVSIDRDLENLRSEAAAISETQKLKNYFKKLDYEYDEDDSNSLGTEREEEENDEDNFDVWEEEFDEDEEEEDDQDILSQGNLTFTLEHDPNKSVLINAIQKKFKYSYTSAQQYQETLKSAMIDYCLPFLLESLTTVTIKPTTSAQQIQLLPLNSFYQPYYTTALLSDGPDSSKVPLHTKSATGNTNASTHHLDFPYLLLLHLNQCMERSQKTGMMEMIDQFHQLLIQFVQTDRHPLIAKILPELIVKDEKNGVKREPSELERVGYLCRLIVRYLEDEYKPQSSLAELNTIFADTSSTNRHILFHSPLLFLYVLLRLQDDTRVESIHEIFNLLQTYSLFLLGLLPTNIQEWNTNLLRNRSSKNKSRAFNDPLAQRHFERKMLLIMDLSCQLQLINTLLVIKANELHEMQRFFRKQVPIDSTTERNADIIISRPEKENLQEQFWLSTQSLLLHYRILVPFLAYIIRTSTLFLTIHTRSDIAYTLLAENMQVDWYNYFHNITHLSAEVIPLEVDTSVPPADSTSSINSLHSLNNDKEMPPSIRTQRSRSSSGYSETPSTPSMKRKYSKAEQWIDMIAPEIDDEGYQYVAILSREQCDEILHDKAIGSFILRPQESFTECNQFILSFRSNGIEVVKHAVIRRENNPASEPLLPPPPAATNTKSATAVPPNRRKYFYRCGKLGPVDSLDGILHAISDIINDPLVFIPVIPSFLSYLQYINDDSAAPRGNIGGTEPSRLMPEFPSFDINYQFWKIIQDILPKLVNTVDMYHVEMMMNQSNPDDPSENEEDMDDDEEISIQDNKPDDDEYVIDDFPNNNSSEEPYKQQQKRSSMKYKRLFKDFLSELNFQQTDKIDIKELNQKWKLSLIHNDYTELVERILIILSIKKYYQQLLSTSFGYLLDSLWKYEIESIPDFIEKKTENDSFTQQTSLPLRPLTEFHRKSILLQVFKDNILYYYDTLHEAKEADLYTMYYDSYLYDCHLNSQLIINPTTPNSSNKSATGISQTGVGGTFGNHSLAGSKIIFAKGLFSTVLRFWLFSERILARWLIPEIDSSTKPHTSLSSSLRLSTASSLQQVKEAELEMILRTNLSYSSYDKISLQYLNDIVDRYTSASSSTTSLSSSSTLYLANSQSKKHVREYSLMEALLLQLYQSCTVKTVRFSGHRNGYGIQEFLLPDCIDVNEMMNTLCKWLTQLEEIIKVLKIKLPCEGGGGSDDLEGQSEDDEEDSEDEIVEEIFGNKRTNEDAGAAKPREIFSKMDFDTDDSEEEEEKEKIQPVKKAASIPSLSSSVQGTETIDLRSPQKVLSSAGDAVKGNEENEEGGGKKKTETKKELFEETKERLFPSIDSTKQWSSIPSSPAKHLLKIFSKLAKRWKKILQLPVFAMTANNQTTTTTGGSSSNPSSSSTNIGPLLLTLETTKLLLQIIDMLQLSNRSLKREIAQKMINWCFLQRALIQITKSSNEMSLYSSNASNTFYHYIDAWEVKVLNDISLAKDHVRLGRQSYTGLSHGIFSPRSSSVASAGGGGADARKKTIIAGDSDLNTLSDTIIKHHFQNPFTMTVASYFKIKRFLHDEMRLLHHQQQHQQGKKTSSSTSSRYDSLNQSMKIEKEQYWEYYCCKLWEYVKAEEYIVDIVCASSFASDPQLYTFVPPVTNSTNYLPLSSVSSGRVPPTVTAGGGTGRFVNPLSFKTPIPRTIQPNMLRNCYSTHPTNRRLYWNGSSEGNSPYIHTLQEYLYKNTLFQRLQFYYRFIGYVQIDFYGLKEILAIHPPVIPPLPSPSVGSSSSSVSLSSQQLQAQQAAIGANNTIHSLNHFTQSLSNQNFASFFGASIVNPTLPTAVAQPQQTTAKFSRSSSTNSLQTTASVISVGSSNPSIIQHGSHSGHSSVPSVVGSGSQVHSSNIVSITPTPAPHSQSIEVYAVIRLVKEHYLRTDQSASISNPSTLVYNTTASSIFGGGFVSAAAAATSAYRSGYYDESYVTFPKKIDLLPNGLFPSSGGISSSFSTATKSILSQIQSSHDYEWRNQSIFRFPLPESWLLLIDDHISNHLTKHLEEDDDHPDIESIFQNEEQFAHYLQTLPPMKIVIMIYEKTFFSDNKIGELEMNLWELNDQNVSRDWFPLTNPENNTTKSTSSPQQVMVTSSSYLLYLQTKLRFHLMQMDGNFTTPTVNNSVAAAAVMANQQQSMRSNHSSSNTSNGSGRTSSKVVGRGQHHPGHLLASAMKKKAGDEDESVSNKDTSSRAGRGLSGSDSPVIKIAAVAKSTMNLYEEEEEDETPPAPEPEMRKLPNPILISSSSATTTTLKSEGIPYTGSVRGPAVNVASPSLQSSANNSVTPSVASTTNSTSTQKKSEEKPTNKVRWSL